MSVFFCWILIKNNVQVTKGHLTDFYFNLNKNVAFGAGGSESKKRSLTPEPEPDKTDENLPKEESRSPVASPSGPSTSKQSEVAAAAPLPPSATAEEITAANEPPPTEKYKRTGDAVAAAKERFLARKKARAHELF